MLFLLHILYYSDLERLV